MKTTILIKENRTQLVLEAEGEFDEEVLKILEKLPNTHRTEFSDCKGGYTRQFGGERDLIIVFDKKIYEEGGNDKRGWKGYNK